MRAQSFGPQIEPNFVRVKRFGALPNRVRKDLNS